MRRTLPLLGSAGALVAAAVAVTALAGPAGPATAAPDGNNGRTKNVIYLLGDGLGRTHITAARERFYGAEGKLAMETLPAQGYVSTYAVEKKSGQPGEPDFKPNLVTDSASAATAWASGVKTYNAALGVDTENPSGALGLYERMGYTPTRRSMAFEKQLTQPQ